MDIHEDARDTYFYLRWLMIALPLMLLVVSWFSARQQGEWEKSISSYYGGPVRDVFVGVIIALAACLVAYRGASLLEDYSLNAAGFYGLFVALIPNSLHTILDLLRSEDAPEGSISADDYIVHLRISLSVVLFLCLLLAFLEVRSKRLQALWGSGGQNRSIIVVTTVLFFAFLGLAMVRLWAPVDDVTMDGFTIGPLHPRIHDLAAYLLILSLAVAVWSHVRPRTRVARQVGQTVPKPDSADQEVPEVSVVGDALPQVGRGFKKSYLTVFLLMLPGAPVVALIVHQLWPDHVVIVLEWYEILLFSLFWMLRTREVSKQDKEKVSEEASVV